MINPKGRKERIGTPEERRKISKEHFIESLSYSSGSLSCSLTRDNVPNKLMTFSKRKPSLEQLEGCTGY